MSVDLWSNIVVYHYCHGLPISIYLLLVNNRWRIFGYGKIMGHIVERSIATS